MERFEKLGYPLFFRLLILLATSVFYSGSASAEAYSWSASGVVGQFASAQLACNAYATSRTQAGTGRYGVVVRLTDTAFRCTVYSSAGVSNSETTVSRRGDSCVAGQYNSASGACEVPNGEKCGEEFIGGATIPKIKNASGQCVPFREADKPSQCKHFAESTRFTTTVVAVDDNGNPVPPPPIVKQGCVANVLDFRHCKAPAPKKAGTISLGPAPVECRVAVNFTGEVADGQPPVFAPPPVEPGDICPEGEECLPPDAPIVNEKEPCVYVFVQDSLGGHLACKSSDYSGKPGDYINCGTASHVNGGKFTCHGKNPSSTGTMTDTKVETKQNADGSTTTTKTDTQTKVVCSGVGSCSTQVTTNVSHTTKDANGNVTSESSKCVGPNCSSSGGIKDGSGTGNGKGDGDGEDQDSEGPAGPTRGLQQGEVGSFAEGLSEWDQRIADARAELDQKLGEYSALFKGVFDLNLSDSSGSLPCEVFSISTGGVSLRICPADYSDQLSYLRYVLLLAAVALAAIIVLRG